jgi:uncharacterized protein YgbK (DUF1537 family)
MTSQKLPDGLLLTYYGDDYTGSTDAMEAMTAAGVPTVLFLQIPTMDDLSHFPKIRCVGLAGSSRGRNPTWMDKELPKAFEALAGLGAPVLQYKICSTFDSSPQVGSIGKAIDIGTRIVGGNWSPCIVGAPRLNRFQLFGNLFAAINGIGYRLDRHPTMSKHPITPMSEADLREHLSQQTQKKIELINMLHLKSGVSQSLLQKIQSDINPSVVLVDVLDDKTLEIAGELVWENRGQGIFTASSSGLEYALTTYWHKKSLLPKPTPLPKTKPTNVIAAVSGSCSPVTAAQIAWAKRNGFFVERLNLTLALDKKNRDTEIKRLVRLAVQATKMGQSSVIFSAEGPDDPCVTGFSELASNAGIDKNIAARLIGSALADVMNGILDQTNIRRIAIAGGDSAGEVASTLEIQALTIVSSLAPGSPLCRAWSKKLTRDGMEVVLKGGQIGSENFFGMVRDGD